MLKFIGRLVWVTISVGLSACVAGAVLLVLGLEQLTRLVAQTSGPDTDTVDRWLAMLDRAGSLWPLASSMTVVPALLVVVAGEVARIRSFFFYLLGGGLSLAGVPLVMAVSRQALHDPHATAFLPVLATAGFAAGAAYWLLAGQRA